MQRNRDVAAGGRLRGASGATRAALLLGALALGGCSSLPAGFLAASAGPEAAVAVEAPVPEPAPVAVAPVSAEAAVALDATLIDPDDDLALGKRQFAEQNYGLAEKHFRRAIEKRGPGGREAEAWIGLAASYDRLRRFELADRAYRQAIRLLGPTPEILNNQGYSYLIRGDYRKARAKLLLASAGDPANPYIQNNLALLRNAAP